ncbi:hypothetical protein ACFQYP_13725 [Nonomuraea antimicrobica]
MNSGSTSRSSVRPEENVQVVAVLVAVPHHGALRAARCSSRYDARSAGNVNAWLYSSPPEASSSSPDTA